jgi:hypothetical protein
VVKFTRKSLAVYNTSPGAESGGNDPCPSDGPTSQGYLHAPSIQHPAGPHPVQLFGVGPSLPLADCRGHPSPGVMVQIPPVPLHEPVTRQTGAGAPLQVHVSGHEHGASLAGADAGHS